MSKTNLWDMVPGTMFFKSGDDWDLVISNDGDGGVMMMYKLSGRSLIIIDTHSVKLYAYYDEFRKFLPK